MKITILSGISGSGKSTLTKNLVQQITEEYQICSADNYWVRPDGIYDFNFKLLYNAHKYCQDICENAMNKRIKYIIIDNTNLQFKELVPYLKLAKKYGYEVEIREADTPWRYDAEELAKRNTHGVPLETIQKMLGRRETVEELTRKTKELLGCI